MDETPSGEGAGWDLYARAIIDGSARAVIITSPDGVIRLWNRKAEELYGWTADEVAGRQVTDVLVPVHTRADADEIMEVVRAGDGWEGDFVVHRKDGVPVQVRVTDRPIHDDDGNVVAIVGASEDVTEQRRLEQRAADLTEHLSLALEAGGLGTFRWDLATGATEWDARLEALFGLQSGEFDGTFDAYVRLLHPDDREGVLNTVAAAVESRQPYTVEHRVIWPDGSVHWLHGAGQVTFDEEGNVTGAIGCSRDVTEQVLAERERQRLTMEALEAAEHERVNRERLEFLASINDALAAAHDRSELMANVTKAAVPRLGDWCSIYVLPSSDARVPEVETAHVDPAMVAYAHELQERFPYDPDAAVGMARVIRTGRPEFYPVIDEPFMDDLDAMEDEREIIRNLALRSAIAVPLVKRGRVLGGLQLVMSKSRRRYTNDDLTLANAVAARIASSLENLRLNEEQRSIASTLQASLLPSELPTIPGIDVAVRYWAAGEGIDVGGDFFDVFELTDDSWSVVVGDVCGKGPVAAALTGLVRHSIASAAWHGDDAVTVLKNLNRTMLARKTDSFCTAVFGTVRPEPPGAVFTFACAGHPLPIVVRADGSYASLGVYGSMLGVFEEIDLSATTLRLNAGDTVVLYTDGATDVAPPHGLSTDEFMELVGRSAAATESAEELADRLHEALSADLPIEQRDDDIALLVLRLPTTP